MQYPKTQKARTAFPLKNEHPRHNINVTTLINTCFLTKNNESKPIRFATDGLAAKLRRHPVPIRRRSKKKKIPSNWLHQMLNLRFTTVLFFQFPCAHFPQQRFLQFL